MATRELLAELAATVERAGLPSLRIESVGGVDAAARVAAGEQVDLVFLAADALSRLAEAGRVDAGTVTPLVLSQVAAAVPSAREAPEAAGTAGGTRASAFADASALRAALRAAPRIGFSTGPSGDALVAMIEAWGLDEELRDRLVQSRPGVPVAASLAAGEVDLGFQQLSELVGRPGIGILGTLPDDCAIETVFGGAVAVAAEDPHRARAVLDFLASDRVAEIKRRHAFGLPPR